MSRFDWVSDSCRLLWHTAAEFDRTQPFKGLRIGTGIHLEPKTAALLLTLQRGGAEVVSTGNLNSTQAETVDYLREHGITVIGGPTSDPVEHDRNLRGVLATRPDLILDNGGDLFARYLEDPYDEPRRRDRGDDVGARPAAAAPGPDRQAAHRHQRQPDQAVRREHPRRRTGHGRGVHADHQPHHERPARDGVRLRVGRSWRRDVLPQLLLDGVRGGAAAGPPAAGRPGRHGGAGPRRRGPLGRRHRHGHRRPEHRDRRGPAAVQGRRDHDEFRAPAVGDRRRGPADGVRPSPRSTRSSTASRPCTWPTDGRSTS